MQILSKEEFEGLKKVLLPLYKELIFPFVEKVIKETKRKKGNVLLFLDPGARAFSYSLEPIFLNTKFFPRILFFPASKRLLGKNIEDWKNWAIINNLKFKGGRVTIIDDVIERGETMNLTQRLVEKLGGKIILKASFFCLQKKKLAEDIICQHTNRNVLVKEIEFEEKKWKVNILSIAPVREIEYFFLPNVGSCISKNFPVKFKSGKVINIYSLFRLRKAISKVPKSFLKNKNWKTELLQKILKRTFNTKSNIAQKELKNLGKYFSPFNLARMQIVYSLPQFTSITNKLKKEIKEIYQNKFR